jgi:hypothetical protein
MADKPRDRMTATDLSTEAGELKSFWSPRVNIVKKWYELLQMKDTLSQKNMESFVGNDPRTFYNLAMYLLTRPRIPHRIPVEGLNPIQVKATSELESFITRQWKRHNRMNRGAGRGTWLNELTSLMLVTGWYSVFCPAHPRGTIADIWHPLETFPEFDSSNPEEGDLPIMNLLRAAHIYQIDVTTARRKILSKGWNDVTLPPRGAVELIDYWWLGEEDARPYNCIIINKQFAKPPEVYNDLPGIPLVCGPVGGLPDRGVIIPGNDWKARTGESVLATNENVFNQYNRQMSFLVQLLRDFSQARWYQKTQDGRQILTTENIFKRGAVFYLGPNDEIGMLHPPSIPVEARTNLFDTRGMIQRGGFPDAMFGNLQQQMAAHVMAQVADSAQQILSPFHQGIMLVHEDVDNIWLWQLRNGLTIQQGNMSYSLSPDIPNDAEFEVDYRIEIPGAMVAKATVARMLNPQFRLSTMTIFDLMFPEILDPIAEYSRALADDSLQHPVNRAIDLYKALRENAQLAEQAQDGDLTQVYNAAAETIKQQITSGAGMQLNSGQQSQVRPSRNVLTPETMSPSMADEGVM